MGRQAQGPGEQPWPAGISEHIARHGSIGQRPLTSLFSQCGLTGMNWSPNLSATYVPLLAKRLFELIIWLLIIPIVVYSIWLERGHTLWLLQIGLLGISLLGVVVVNLETAIVACYCRQGEHRRGLLQRWVGSTASARTSCQPLSPLESAPFISVIVVAYLPNEQDIILETLQHWLTQVNRPPAGWELVLAYNTPTWLPVEKQLQHLASQHPELKLLRVEQSHSKAENLNAALQQVQGEMTCIFDADHRPVSICLERAWAWLGTGQYDVVQGRNVIRNHNDNWLTTLVTVEFECLYGVSHFGRSLLVDTALFGGSNGYWRTSVIQKVGFSASRLTEDIDATLRALMQGYRIVHDPAIITTELAPANLRSLWLQRQRWCQGWMETAWHSSGAMLRSPHLDLFQKICWGIMLLYSQYFYPLIWQVIPVSLSVALVDPNRDFWMEAWNLGLMGILNVSIMAQVFVAIRLKPSISGYSWSYGLMYCLMSPLYFWFKVLIALSAGYNHLCGDRVWHVTQRTQRPARPWLLGNR